MPLIFRSTRGDLYVVNVEKTAIDLYHPIFVTERLRHRMLELDAEKMVGHRLADRVELGVSAIGVAYGYVEQTNVVVAIIVEHAQLAISLKRHGHESLGFTQVALLRSRHDPIEEPLGSLLRRQR